MDSHLRLVTGHEYHKSEYYRTELGRAFAECCVPKFEGEDKWHPYQTT